MKSLLTWFKIGRLPRARIGGASARRLTLESLERREVRAAMADLVAYRPVTESVDYSKYSVQEAIEADPLQGPGIRINGDDDNRNGVADRFDKSRTAVADNDLVRVDVRSNSLFNKISWTGNLAVWTSANKQLSVSNGQFVLPGQQLWVEYVGINHSTGKNTALTLTSIAGKSTASDTVVFHTFKSAVIAIGGAFQDPKSLQGTFAIAVGLYQQGYDVHLYRDTAVNKQGTGADFGQVSAYSELKSAILQRGVSNIAMVGMSYGGGAVHDLASALEANPSLKGRLQYTAYIDAIQHYSIPPMSEQRVPAGTKFHDSIFQTNDVLVHGDKATGANRNIDASNWKDSSGAKLNHGTIDKDVAVQNTISTSLKAHLASR